MVATDFRIHISARKLIGGLVLALIPLIVIGIYTATKADAAGREAVGSRFAVIASISASDVSRYIEDRILSVFSLARNPAVITAATTANRASQGESEAAFQSRVQRTDEAWDTQAADALVRSILDSPASKMFRDQITVDPRILRVLLTDQHGVVVAASHKSLDYYQGDEEPWREAYAEGRGAAYVSQLRFDEVTGKDFVYIAAPVAEPDSNSLAGVLEVLIDVAGLMPPLPSFARGSTFRQVLVNHDGIVVAGPETVFSMKVASPEYAAVRSAIGDLAGHSGYVETQVSDGVGEVIGYADTGLGSTYKHLDLQVLATQETREAMAGVREVTRLIWIFAISAVALMTLAVVYFALHRKVRYEDIADALAPRAGAMSLKEGR